MHDDEDTGSNMLRCVYGDKVRFVAVADQMSIGNKGCLEMLGQTYTIDYIIIRSWHTEVYLIELPGIAFNSVSFVNITLEGTTDD